MTRLDSWLRRYDPDLTALRKAVRLSLVVTTAFAIAMVASDNKQLSVFASFGSVAFLLFADFPGDRAARFGAYLTLALFGAVLIVLGTLASPIGWLAVAGMAVVGFLVTFSGVVSAAAAGATRALLLAFILPVTIPADVADIPARLAGWGLATALAIPAALLIWPPRDHDEIRSRSAKACKAIAERLRYSVSALSLGSLANAQSAQEEATKAVDALYKEFRSVTFRPVGLTSGSRYLSHLADQLQWLTSVAGELEPYARRGMSDEAMRVVRAAADVLESCADTLGERSRSHAGDADQLSERLAELERAREYAAAFVPLRSIVPTTREAKGPAASAHDPEESPADGQRTAGQRALIHQLTYTSQLVGETIVAVAKADARSWRDGVLGRGRPTLTAPIATLVSAERIAARRIGLHSVWLHNSIRASIGLTAAVAITEVTHVSHSFWVVLGTLSVLRTTALSTGSTAVRALVGTFVGFLVGAALVVGLGTSPVVLWILLPAALVIAGFAPEAISFVAGQAAFTVLVVILFNLIDPVGWSVGLTRIEDVGLGCAAGLVSGLLLWPSGAERQIRWALGDSQRASADALASAVRSIVDPAAEAEEAAHRELTLAMGASGRLDDALRGYLAERGSKAVSLHEITVAANGSRRVWLAAEAIAGATPPGYVDPHLSPARAEVVSETDETADWYRAVAAAIEGRATAPPVIEPADAEMNLLRWVSDHPAALRETSAELDVRALWEVSLHVDGVTRLQSRVKRSVDTLSDGSGTASS